MPKMMKTIRAFLIATACVIAGMFLFIWVVFRIPAGRAVSTIEAADHAALLAACRQTIADRPQYTNDRDPDVTWMDEWVTCKRGSQDYQRRLPAALRDLDPNWVLIGTNQVVVSFRGPPARVYVRGFMPDAKQFGTRQLIDGLWIQH